MGNQSRENSANKAEQRKRIVCYAIEAFRCNGIRSITMDEIAASLGMSKRTLYELFEDKEALLCECLRYTQRVKEQKVSRMIAKGMNVLEVILASYQESISYLLKADRRFFSDIKRYPKAQALIADSRKKNSDSTVLFFRQGVEQGLFRDDVNFDILNILVHQQLDALTSTDILEYYSVVEVYETIMFTYIRGIATSAGADKLDAFISREYCGGKKKWGSGC